MIREVLSENQNLTFFFFGGGGVNVDKGREDPNTTISRPPSARQMLAGWVAFFYFPGDPDHYC